MILGVGLQGVEKRVLTSGFLGRLGFSIMDTKKLTAEAISLPVDERSIVIDSLLNSLNPPESKMDRE